MPGERTKYAASNAAGSGISEAQSALLELQSRLFSAV